MTIAFKRIQSKTRLLNPFKDFSLDEITFEIRHDPLTGETGRIYDLPYKAPEIHDLEETIQRSREAFCPFCPASLEKSTPLFPREFIPEGRITKGEATLIPNLVPFDTYAGVSIVSKEHYIPMAGLTAERMVAAFSAALEFIRRVIDFDSRVHYYYINWNYMPQSGSSLVHPHLQVNCGYVPTFVHRLQLEGLKKYCDEKGKNFWQDFMNAEKKLQERYIGEIGSTFWTMSFVPQSFLPDMWCIFKEHHSLVQAGLEEVNNFIQGLSRTLLYFDHNNIPAFNVSIFSTKEDANFRVNAKICPRLLPRPIGNSDRAYLQVLHKESYTVRPPEAICPKVRKVFT